MNEENEITVGINPNKDNVKKFSEISFKKVMKESTWKRTFAFISFFLFLTLFVLSRLGDQENDLKDFIFIIIGIVASYWIYMFFVFLIVQEEYSLKDYLQGKSISIAPRGLRDVSEFNDSLISWLGIIEIVKTKKQIIFFINPTLAHIVSINDFDSPEKAEEFYQTALEYWKEANENTDVEDSDE